MCAVTAAHSANVLDSEGRELVALQMLDQLKRLLDGRRVTVETVLLRDIILPDMLPVDIEARQLADQPSRLTQFVQERELVQGQ